MIAERRVMKRRRYQEVVVMEVSLPRFIAKGT